MKERIRLVNGKWDDREDGDWADRASFSGLTLEGVQFAHLSGSDSEDAIVVLRYDSGGTQYHFWVYLYGIADGEPKLLGFFHAGDLAYYGLDRVSEEDGILNVQVLDPKLRQGDCCSNGYVNYKFRWNKQGFESVGKPVAWQPDPDLRRPVSIFGVPIPPR